MSLRENIELAFHTRAWLEGAAQDKQNQASLLWKQAVDARQRSRWGTVEDQNKAARPFEEQRARAIQRADRYARAARASKLNRLLDRF